MRRMRRLAHPLVVLGIALAAAGCGQDDRGLIEEPRSQDLLAAVDRIQAACDDQDIAAAQAAIDEASAQVSELPRRVDDGLQDNMREWLDHISGRLDRDCAPEEEEETPTPEPTPTATETPEPTPTETPEPTPPPEEEEEEEEEEPQPEEEVPPPEEEEPPPEGDPGGGVPAPEIPGEGE
jgi:outer membrane biosynthesis protein TonB